MAAKTTCSEIHFGPVDNSFLTGSHVCRHCDKRLTYKEYHRYMRIRAEVHKIMAVARHIAAEKR